MSLVSISTEIDRVIKGFYCISNNHADSTFLSAYELHYAIWTTSQPLNKLRSRAVWKLRTHHFLLLSVGSSSHSKNAPVNMMVCAICLSIFLWLSSTLLWSLTATNYLWRTELGSWQTASYPHQNYTLDTSFIHVSGSHFKPHLRYNSFIPSFIYLTSTVSLPLSSLSLDASIMNTLMSMFSFWFQHSKASCKIFIHDLLIYGPFYKHKLIYCPFYKRRLILFPMIWILFLHKIIWGLENMV